MKGSPAEGAGQPRGKAAEPPRPTADPQQRNPSPRPALDPELMWATVSNLAEGRDLSQNSGAFYSEWDAWSSPGGEIHVGAALGRSGFGRSLLLLRGSEPAKRIWGQRSRVGDPSRLPSLSPAPQHRGSLPGSEGCWLQVTAFPAIGRDFPTLVLFQPTLHLHLFVKNFVVWDV